MCQFVTEDREMTAVQIFLGINVDPTVETTSPCKLQKLHQLLKRKDRHGASQLLPAYEEGDGYEFPSRLSLAVNQLKQNAAEEMALLAKIAANICMFTPGTATTLSTSPTTDGGYGVDNNAALVNALAPRLNKDEKDTARYAEAKIWLKAPRAREHNASLRPSKKAVTLFPKYEDGEIPVKLPSYAKVVEAGGMIPTAKDRESALLSAKIALFVLGYAYAGPVPKNVTEYSASEAYVTGNKDGSAGVVAASDCLLELCLPRGRR
eukprot:4355981-Pleurochrysis_carterae.AAC.4